MTNNLVAKPIIKDQYWVVTDGDKKVGNVIATGSGFDVIVNGKNLHYENTSEIQKKNQIEFLKVKTLKSKSDRPYAEFPTTDKVYNSMMDVKRKLHLYTKSIKSKCFHAAGWYVMNHTGQNKVVFCPKYIFIKKYQYTGPYRSRLEAENQINSI